MRSYSSIVILERQRYRIGDLPMSNQYGEEYLSFVRSIHPNKVVTFGCFLRRIVLKNVNFIRKITIHRIFDKAL